MRKAAAILSALFLIAGFLVLHSIIYSEKPSRGAPDFKNAAYVINGERVLLKDGFAEAEAAPGSASKIVTRYFGNELYTDLNDDGRSDVVFLLTQETGGSGTFFYAVAALNTEHGYSGSDGYFLGDRIAPQSTNLSENPRHKNVVVVNYADRPAGAPMSVQPSVGKSAYLKLDTASMQWGVVMPDFEGESNIGGKLTCEDTERYFVVTRERDTGEVGEQILLKRKATPSQTFECAYAVAPGDIELIEPGPAYFLAVAGEYVLLDHGTAPPPRGLTVYDINAKKEVYTDLYNRPFEIGQGSFTYWQPIDTKPTAANCPDLQQYVSNGLGAGIERHVRLDFANLKVADLKETRCTARQ